MHSEGEKLQCTWIEVNTDQLKENFRILAQEMAPAEIMPVIKSHAYGHGFDLAFQTWKACGVRYLGVDSVLEGKRLRALGYKDAVVLIGLILPEQIAWLNCYGLQLCLASQPVLRAWLAMEDPPQCYLKCDTGLSRQGFRAEEFIEVLRLVRASPFSDRVLGVMSHCSHRMEAGKDPQLSIEQQVERFEPLRRRAAEMGLAQITHMASSTSAVIYPPSRYDLVRLGGLLYGVFIYPASRSLWFSQVRSEKGTQNLRAALEWKSRIGQIKTLKKNDRVGYDGDFVVPEDGFVVATLPVGYSHGYSRAMGAHPDSHVLIGGEMCPVVGLVSMAMMMVALPRQGQGFKVGDEAVLLGCHHQREITVEQLAAWGGRTAYELLVALSPDMPRIEVRAA